MSSSSTPPPAKGLHRGYSCPSIVPSKPYHQQQQQQTLNNKSTIQHSLSVSLSSCQHVQQQKQQPSITTFNNALQQGERKQTHHHVKKEQDTTTMNNNNNNKFSPLTEPNLKEHTIKMAYGRESRHRRVKCYVDSQVQLLRLEAELERRRRMEIRSLVPLDTNSYDEDVILLSNEQDEPVNDRPHEDEEHYHHAVYHDLNTTTEQKKSMKRGSLRFVKRWLSLYSKKSSISSLKQERDLQQYQQQQKNKKRHTISFEQYQQDKAHLIGQGLNGLSNQNIARALGAGGLASVVFSPPPSPVLLTSTTSSTLQHKQNDSQITSTSYHQKRDSGVSLFSKSTSKKEQSYDHHNLHMSRSNSFVSARYPKMIHLKTLRGAAIQALSSDFSLGEESVYCCSTDLPTNCCSCPPR